MQIHFRQVTPEPLASTLEASHTLSTQEAPPRSEIWRTEITFEPNKKYQVYAPSGKGKSTFIHIIYGLRQDYKGEVQIDEYPVQKIKALAWAKIRQSRMSVVFQDLRLFMDLSAEENIQVKAVLQTHDQSKLIKEMADYLGVSHVLSKKAHLLSYGERQRISIIRALVQPFECILLDEPFSHLDEENIKKACQLLEEKRKENQATMIMTSLGYPYYIDFDQRLIL